MNGETSPMSAPGWHPLIVHFPLALVVTAALALLAARLWPDEAQAARFGVVGTWNLCAGALGALFALGTGLAAVVHAHLSAAAHAAVSVHVKWAVVAAFFSLLLAVWRGAGGRQDSRPSWVFLAMLLFAAGALVETGYRGGLNVYVYAIGVAAPP